MSHNSQIEELTSQLAEARAMAFKMMSANAEMGQITQFLKRSFTSTDYAALAQDLLNHLASQGLQASVSFVDPNGRRFFTLNACEDLMDEALISKHLNAGRLVEVGNRLIINYEHSSLLVENVPDEDEVKGALRDNLAILMESVEARVNSLTMASRVEESHRAKEAFFELMSHELRTPLNPIIGFATRLHGKLQSQLEQKDAQALQQIRDHGEHLLRQINDILEFLRVRSGSINLHPERTNIRLLILHAIQELQSLAEQYKVDVEAVPVEQDLIFYGDPQRLSDVLVGLLSNAIKYSPGGQVKLNLLVQSVNDDDEQLVLEVQDSGRGIDSAQFERIFHHFTDRDSVDCPVASSPGVSLHIARELVRLHGGDIAVSSQLGEGSCFTVTLPGVGICVQ